MEHLDSRVYDPTLDAYGSGCISQSQQLRPIAMVQHTHRAREALTHGSVFCAFWKGVEVLYRGTVSYPPSHPRENGPS